MPTRFPIAVLAETTPEWRAELLRSLAAHPPHLVIRMVGVGSIAASIGRTTDLLPEIPAMLASGYERIAAFETAEVWRRRPVSRGG